MYPNHNIHEFQAVFSNVKLIDDLRQDFYRKPFYSHLIELNKYYILDTENPKERVFNKMAYNGLSQFVIEKDCKDGGENVDWDYIDNALDVATELLNKQLGTEAKSEVLKPFKETTLEAIENYLIYSYSGKEKAENPFNALTQILGNGCLHLVSDNVDLIKDIYPKALEKKEDTKNIGVLAASKKYNKRKKENQFSGFFVDNRLNNQMYVYKLLQHKAKGRLNAKSTKKIEESLLAQGRRIDTNELKANVLIPLKREGLIGSCNRGFFFIDDLEDYKETYLHHADIVKSIQKTQNAIIEKAVLSGHTDFEEQMYDIIKNRY